MGSRAQGLEMAFPGAAEKGEKNNKNKDKLIFTSLVSRYIVWTDKKGRPLIGSPRRVT